MKTGGQVVTSRQVQRIVKYGTSVMPGGKQIAAMYCQTGIMSNTVIRLRNKVMAGNQRLLKRTNQLAKVEK